MLVNAELEPIQLETTIKALEKRKAIVALEMRMGKTFVSLALLSVASELYPDLKNFVTVPTSKLQDMENKVREHLPHIKFISSNGDEKHIKNFIENFTRTNYFIVTPSFWKSLDASIILYNYREKLGLMYWDEAEQSQDKGYKIFLELARISPMTFFASATPNSRTSVEVLYNMLYGIGAYHSSYNQFLIDYCDKDFSQNKLNNILRIDRVLDVFGDYFIFGNAKDIGVDVDYEVTFHRLTASAHQETWLSQGMPQPNALHCPVTESILQGFTKYYPTPTLDYSTVPQYLTLMNLLSSLSKEENVIVYTRYTDNLFFLKNTISLTGFNILIIDGQNSNKSAEIEEKFNNSRGNVIIITIEKGLNLGSASRIVLMNTPTDLTQTLFRSVRSREYEILKVNWFYYPKYESQHLLSAANHIKDIYHLTNRDPKLASLILKEYSSI